MFVIGLLFIMQLSRALKFFKFCFKNTFSAKGSFFFLLEIKFD